MYVFMAHITHAVSGFAAGNKFSLSVDFKTLQCSGILFYNGGNGGKYADYFLLEIGGNGDVSRDIHAEL